MRVSRRAPEPHSFPASPTMADSREARPVVGAGHSSAAPLQGTFWEALREVDSLRAPPTRLCADWARSHGLEADADAAVLDHVAPALPRIVYDALRTPVPALNDFDVDDLLSFRVPEVNEDGTCNAFNKLQVLPFRIHVAVYGYPKSRPVAMTDALVRRLWRLRRVRWRRPRPRDRQRRGVFWPYRRSSAGCVRAGGASRG